MGKTMKLKLFAYLAILPMVTFVNTLYAEDVEEVVVKEHMHEPKRDDDDDRKKK